MLRNQAISLFRHDRIQTTLEKAKGCAVSPKPSPRQKDTLHSRRIAARKVDDRSAQKLFATSDLTPAAGRLHAHLKLGAPYGALVAIIGWWAASPRSKGPPSPERAKRRPLRRSREEDPVA